MVESNHKFQLTQKIWLCEQHLRHLPLPFFIEKVSAGFPSPADGYLDKALDLNDLMIEDPPATFFVRVEGDSMVGAGIYSGDLLVVNRAKEPVNGKIVIAAYHGELTVKRIKILNDGQIRLEAANKEYPPILVTPECDFTVWGIVTGVVRQI